MRHRRLRPATLILMIAAMRRRAIVVLLPAFVTTALVCWGFQGFLPNGIPFGPLVLVQWQALVLIPVIGVITCLTGLRLYERLLRRREPEKTRTA